MIAHGQLWMFEPVATMSPEQWQRWRQGCHYESDIDTLLGDPARSIVVSTSPGCGFTTSLYLLRSTDLLLFSYNPDQWPGGSQAFTAAETHFGQWMGLISDLVITELSADPARISLLDMYQHQFILWMLQRHLGRRQALIWQGQLQSLLTQEQWSRILEVIEQNPIEYNDTIADLKHQLHEWILIARRLGWRGVYAGVDIRWWDWVERSAAERERFNAQLRELLTTLAPLEVPYFGLKLGLPAQQMSLQEIDRLARARMRPSIYPASYRWDPSQLQRICEGLVELAVAETGHSRPLPPASLWSELAPVLESIWGRLCPAAATSLARAWFELPSSGADHQATLQALQVGLYRRAAPLRLDPSSQIVRRGNAEIPLDDMPFRVFELLWQHRGAAASNETLLRVAGTKANLDKLISRLREQIEPLYRLGVYIYLQRRPNSGTWLEKDVCLFT